MYTVTVSLPSYYIQCARFMFLCFCFCYLENPNGRVGWKDHQASDCKLKVCENMCVCLCWYCTG